MVIMSVDYGEVRTGLAICDKNEVLAYPLAVLEDKNGNFKRSAQKVSEYAKAENAELIIVGEPRNMDGSFGEKSQICRDYAKLIERLSGIKTQMFDERRTTLLATDYLNITNTRGKKRKAAIDKLSAVIILEEYLKYASKI